MAVSPMFETFHTSLRNRLCSNEAVTEKLTYSNLFLEYCQNYWYLFEEMRESFCRNSLLDIAWLTCDRSDLNMFYAISQETKNSEDAVLHNKAGLRPQT